MTFLFRCAITALALASLLSLACNTTASGTFDIVGTWEHHTSDSTWTLSFGAIDEFLAIDDPGDTSAVTYYIGNYDIDEDVIIAFVTDFKQSTDCTYTPLNKFCYFEYAINHPRRIYVTETGPNILFTTTGLRNLYVKESDDPL